MGGKTSAKSINKYMDKAYDRLNIVVPKGKKDIYKAHAERKGTSLNALVQQLLDEDMAK